MTLDFGRTDTVKTQDNLIAGDMPKSEVGVTIVSGQSLVRGAPLGRVTASGKYTEWDPNASDGSQTFKAILAEDVDASSADEKGLAYFSGQFRKSGIAWDTDKHQDDDILDAILEGQGRGIYIEDYDVGVLEASYTSTTTTTTTSSSTTTTTTA